MNLSNWIKEVGQSNTAKKLGISTATVNHWLKYKALPRPLLMIKIHELSCGAVTYKEMIEDFVAHKEVKP